MTFWVCNGSILRGMYYANFAIHGRLNQHKLALLLAWYLELHILLKFLSKAYSWINIPQSSAMLLNRTVCKWHMNLLITLTWQALTPQIAQQLIRMTFADSLPRRGVLSRCRISATLRDATYTEQPYVSAHESSAHCS